MKRKIYYFFGLSEPIKPGYATPKRMAEAMYCAAEGCDCEIYAVGFSREMAGAILSGPEEAVMKLSTGMLRRARKAFKVHRTILLGTREMLKHALLYVLSSNDLTRFGALYGRINVRRCLRLKKNLGISEEAVSEYDPDLFVLMISTNSLRGASDEHVGRYMAKIAITMYHCSLDKCPEFGKKEIVLETSRRFNTCASQIARVSGISVSETAGILLKSRP